MGRFSHRPKRLSRRAEREKFNIMVMPAVYICLPVAVAVLLGAGLNYAVHGNSPREVLILGSALLAIPIVLMLFRLLRGHYSKALDQP